MKSRCLNPNDQKCKNYGARGITICEEWIHDFPTYLRDVESLGIQPSPVHTIDRIDNDGPYAPGNIRWASPGEQRRNRQAQLVTLSFQGRTLCLTDWAIETGFDFSTIAKRVKAGWSAEDTLTKTPRYGNRVEK